MERFTKIVVLVWTVAAIAAELWLVSSSWPRLPFVATLVLAAALLLGTIWPQAISAVLLFSYFSPALVRLVHGGTPYAPYDALWIAALVGFILPAAVRSTWQMPARWRAPLVTGVLAVIVCVPIVALREIDLTPGLLFDLRGWSFGGPVWPSLVVTWTLHVGLTFVVGVLWFDWLFSQPRLDFHRAVLTPLALSALVLAGVSIYQLLVDLSFLNETVFAGLGRASGTMYDANVSGTLAALWIGGALLWCQRLPRYRAGVMAVTTIAFWLAVWAAGSRTAFAAAAIVTAFGVLGAATGRQLSVRQAWTLAGAVVVGLLVFGAFISVARPNIVGPLARVWATLPEASLPSIQAFLGEMWNRNNYGAVASAMIRESPWFGVGLGTYHSIAGDYFSGGVLPPDNAQNWLRHLVAESGVVGSAGWLIWFVLFALSVLRMRWDDAPAAWITRGVLIAFAAISFLGVPGQNVIVAITFWTFAFWYLKSTGVTSDVRPLRHAAWIVMVAIAVIAGAGTTYLAMTRLRVPARAVSSTWPYSYGMSAPDTTGERNGYRRIRHRAVAVLDAPTRWLVVTVRLEDNQQNEVVDVRVWGNGSSVLKGRLTGSAPLTAVVPVAVAPARFLLETSATRADRFRWLPDRRADPPLLMKWEFLERPSANPTGYPRSMTS